MKQSIKIEQNKYGSQILIDIKIDGQNKRLLLDTGARKFLLLDDKRNKIKLGRDKINGMFMDFTGSAGTVKVEIGPYTKNVDCLFLDRNTATDDNFIENILGSDGIIGFGLLRDIFNGINVDDHFVFQRKEEGKYASIDLHPFSKQTDQIVFEMNKFLFIVDSGAYHSKPIFPEKKDIEFKIKIPNHPVYLVIETNDTHQFTYNSRKNKTKDTTFKNIVLLGMDFLFSIRSFFIIGNKLYLESMMITPLGLEISCDHFYAERNSEILTKKEPYKFPDDTLILTGRNKVVIR